LCRSRPSPSPFPAASASGFLVGVRGLEEQFAGAGDAGEAGGSVN